MRYTAYMALVGMISLSALIVVISINYAIDPYDLDSHLVISGYNARKFLNGRNVRLLKAVGLWRNRPVAVAFGTSRVDHGIDVTAAEWPTSLRPAYNSAFPAASMSEILDFVRHASADGRLRTAVIGLDVNMFAQPAHVDGFDPRILSSPDAPGSIRLVGAIALTYASLDALVDSVRTVRMQATLTPSAYDNYGGRTEDFFVDRLARMGGYRHVFERSMADMLGSDDKRGDNVQRRFSAVDNAQFTAFKDMLRFAREHRIDLRMFISPGHAEERHARSANGRTLAYEYWRQTLLSLLEEESMLAGEHPFQLWDFGGPSAMNDEALPRIEEPAGAMHWYWDPVHYKRALGNVVLGIVFGDSTTTYGELESAEARIVGK